MALPIERNDNAIRIFIFALLFIGTFFLSKYLLSLPEVYEFFFPPKDFHQPESIQRSEHWR